MLSQGVATIPQLLVLFEAEEEEESREKIFGGDAARTEEDVAVEVTMVMITTITTQ